MSNPRPRQFDLIAFDWDGTLYDSTQIIVRCIQAAVTDVGGAKPSDEQAGYVIRMALMPALAHAAPDVPKEKYPLLGELADPDQLARLPKEFFLDACSVPNNATVSQPPLPLAIQANSSARTVLFITDEPARSKDLRLELAWKGSVDLAAPSIRINGVELKELKLDRDKTDFTAVSASRLEQGESFLTIACNSASLATLLRRGANDFVFTSTSAATLTALSLKITPEFQKPTSPAK